jgi:hypothetical protein
VSRESQNIYSSAQWKKIRAQVLRDEPVCHWCKRRPATEADHLVELDRGGEPYERSNLVGACKPCNASRGSTYQAKTMAAKRQRLGALYSVTESRNCLVCSKAFTPDWRNVKRGYGHCCSVLCSGELRRRKAAQKRTVATLRWKCAVCNTQVEREASITKQDTDLHKSRRTCGSDECLVVWNRVVNRNNYRKKKGLDLDMTGAEFNQDFEIITQDPEWFSNTDPIPTPPPALIAYPRKVPQGKPRPAWLRLMASKLG